MRRLRQTHEAGEVTFSESSVLSRLDRDGPATPGALAAAEGVRPQAMAATAGELERRGLLGRTADPRDGRRAVLTLTPQGCRVLTDRRRASAKRLAQALRTFDPIERQQLKAAVPLLERLAERL
jgi:DNA-binding MarR family transcriptional regulator